MDIQQRVIKVIEELRPDIELQKALNENNNLAFIEDGIFDSFDIISLVSALDKEFTISIDGSKIIAENFNTLENIVLLVAQSYGDSSS
ncbi:acyl carrier protein [Helicobacter aurati]|uniref:Acyl carrier protein n=1 Tax=Helicobacter aurati TaxID=137778 RepID=A0A3D8IZU8_9HELI|nr:acyl carrier protein [Helicobacter aurati]RDU70613.1 acyl carrier protein [Helicobacter aurati]